MWLAVSTEHFEPRARSSRSIPTAAPARCRDAGATGSTYMSAHHDAPAASTLRTRPTICSPSQRHVLAERSVIREQIARDRPGARHLAQPGRQLRRAPRARSGREMAALGSVSAAARRSLPSRAADSREPCMRFASARPALPSATIAQTRIARARAVARPRPPSRVDVVRDPLLLAVVTRVLARRIPHQPQAERG